MKIFLLFFSAVLLPALIATGQTDKDAVKILDAFSAKALEAPSVSMRFQLITSDIIENRNDTLAGSIILNKDKYRLDLSDNITWFNGETSWSYLPAEKEVTITKPDKKDNSFQNHPSGIYTMYKKGYKSRLIEEKSDSYIIDLYPENIKTDLIRIRLLIGKSQMNLRSIEYKKKDGIVVTLNVREYNLKTNPEPDAFTFVPSKYKGVEVNDMR